MWIREGRTNPRAGDALASPPLHLETIGGPGHRIIRLESPGSRTTFPRLVRALQLDWIERSHGTVELDVSRA